MEYSYAFIQILSFSLIGDKGLLLSVFLGKLFGEDRSNC